MEGHRVVESPYLKQRQEYVEAIKALEESLKALTSTAQTPNDAFEDIQVQLDALADTYQHDNTIGTARYKLYELQASIHYFKYDNERALEFIELAIEQRGHSYPKAERLREALVSKAAHSRQHTQPDEATMTKAEKRKKLIGVEGWLAWFVVGLIFTTAITIFNFFNDGFLSSSDVSAFNEYQVGLGNSMQTLAAFENTAIIIYIVLLVASVILLLRRRKVAKQVVITALIFGVVYGIVDLAITSSIFNSLNLTDYAQAELSKYSGEVGKSIVGAFIWVPYFFVSKRVKATLTK